MAVFILLTKNGVLDPGQTADLAKLAQELQQPNRKLLLHLHGGLVDEASGKAIASRLSGAGPDSWQLGADWTQVYVVWRTGAFETIKTNWQDLITDDRLYRVIVRKLIEFVAKRIGLPTDVTRGPGTFELDGPTIDAILDGQVSPNSFDRVDNLLASEPVSGPGPGSRDAFVPDQSSEELALEFQDELSSDIDYEIVVSDIHEATKVPSGARSASASANAARGDKIVDRLDDNIKSQLQPPPTATEPVRGILTTSAILLKHASTIALRCFSRFKNGRDHGLHATIVEEVCRELYGDLVGAKIWGMMVKDAADHFLTDKLGTQLIDLIKKNQPERFVLSGHSAGSIWASHFLLAAEQAQLQTKARLLLLAPAVRETLFAEVLDNASNMIDRCLMITMNDALERKDAVLGHDKGHIYPSSLLYLVSGLFEERNADAYVDAPLLGMRRFDGLKVLEPDEAVADAKIAAFFQRTGNGIIVSPSAGQSMSSTHGGFDSEPFTLASARGMFMGA